MNSGGTGHTTTSDGGCQAGKVRLYEVAKDLGLANKDLVAKVRALGIEVKNHMSNLESTTWRASSARSTRSGRPTSSRSG